MSAPSVSIHPYFKVHPGKMEAAQALIPRFIEKTKTEAGCLFYEFTVAGDVVFCREAYTTGEAALAHLGNVDAELKEMLSYSDLERLELHGPADELQVLRAPLAGLSPTWFEFAGGLER